MSVFDDCINDNFPDHDKGYPQTAATLRVHQIVSSAYALAGIRADVYNVRHTGWNISFNVKVSENDGGWIVSASYIGLDELRTCTDAALITEMQRFIEHPPERVNRDPRDQH